MKRLSLFVLTAFAGLFSFAAFLGLFGAEVPVFSMLWTNALEAASDIQRLDFGSLVARWVDGVMTMALLFVLGLPALVLARFFAATPVGRGDHSEER